MTHLSIQEWKLVRPGTVFCLQFTYLFSYPHESSLDFIFFFNVKISGPVFSLQTPSPYTTIELVVYLLVRSVLFNQSVYIN